MSQDKITFDEKSNNVSIVDRQKQVAAEDLNEIKEVVNNNADDADERISALEESQTSGTVTSVNDKEPDAEGNVSLTPDDLDDSETTNKFVTADDIETLGNTSGTNSGDQDLTNYFDKTSDTVTEDLIEDGAVTDAKLSESGATAGTYSIAKVTVNNKGRITNIEEGSISVGLSSVASNLYASTTESDVSGYNEASYSVLDSEAVEESIEASDSDTIFYGEKYLFASSYNETLIDNGQWQLYMYGRVSSSAGESKIILRAFVYEADGTETELFVATGDEIDVSSNQANYVTFSAPSYTINSTDRVGYQIGIQTSSPSTITLYYVIGDGYATHLVAPFKARHSGLRDKNEESNYKHVDTDTYKTTPIAADSIPIYDSTNSNIVLLLLSNLVIYLKSIFTYFDTDSNTLDDISDGATYVKFSTTEQTKLSGIEDEAEVNNITTEQVDELTGLNDTSLHYHSEDRDRDNHTGTQLMETISDAGALAVKDVIVTSDINDDAVTDAKLSDSGVTSGTYYDTNKVTVNSQGRVTSISSGTTVTEYNITSNNPTITCNFGILEKLYVTIDSSVTDMSETVWVTSWSNGNTLTSRGTIVINNETSLDLDLNLTVVNFENGLTSNYLFEPGVTRLYYNVSGGEVFYGLASGPDSPTERYEDLTNSSDVIDIDCKYKNNFVSSNRVTLSTATTITISNDDNLRFATFKYSSTAGDTITFPTGSISADGNWSSLVWTAPETGYFTASIYKTGTEYEITFTQGGAV
jgi:hypothetical protein